MRVLVAFADHAGERDIRRVIGFLNALTRGTETTGQRRYDFTFTRPGKLAHARPTLSEWEREGLITWEERE